MITIEDFSEQHGLVPSHIYVARNHGKLPHSIFSKLKGCKTRIDETFIIRRKEFRERIQHENMEMYYILSEHYTNSEIGRLLEDKTPGIGYHNWRAWLGSRLWYPIPESILSYLVPRYHYLFYKYARKLIRDLDE